MLVLLLMLLNAVVLVNPASTPGSVLHVLDAGPQGQPGGLAGWGCVEPWEERRLRTALGSAETPADRVLQRHGLLDAAAGRGAGGWSSALYLSLNGTENLRQACQLRLIRATLDPMQAQQQLTMALLGVLYTEALIIPSIEEITRSAPGADAQTRAAVDLTRLATFAKSFPRTNSETALLKARRAEKHSKYGYVSPFGRIETPAEKGVRRRREAFENRLAFLGLTNMHLDLPTRQDLVTALDLVPRCDFFAKSIARVPHNSSQWTLDEAGAVARHLCKAAAVGDLSCLQELLALGASVGGIPLIPRPPTFLHSPPLSLSPAHPPSLPLPFASDGRPGSRDLTRADTASAPPWADSPLHLAARFGQLEAVSWLLSRGARPQVRREEVVEVEEERVLLENPRGGEKGGARVVGCRSLRVISIGWWNPYAAERSRAGQVLVLNLVNSHGWY